MKKQILAILILFAVTATLSGCEMLTGSISGGLSNTLEGVWTGETSDASGRKIIIEWTFDGETYRAESRYADTSEGTIESGRFTVTNSGVKFSGKVTSMDGNGSKDTEYTVNCKVNGDTLTVQGGSMALTLTRVSEPSSGQTNSPALSDDTTQTPESPQDITTPEQTISDLTTKAIIGIWLADVAGSDGITLSVEFGFEPDMRYFTLWYLPNSSFAEMEQGSYTISGDSLFFNVEKTLLLDDEGWMTGEIAESAYSCKASIVDGQLIINSLDDMTLTLTKAPPSYNGLFDGNFDIAPESASTSIPELTPTPTPTPKPTLTPTPTPKPTPAPKPTTAAESTSQEDNWPLIELGIYGGPIKIGFPVSGVISNEKNLHQFTLLHTDMPTSEHFGIKLVITADSDEEFEINFCEYFAGSGLHFGGWHSKYENKEHVTIKGRTMTIKYPIAKYPRDDYVWQINCPEYQWEDGSNMKLNFTFLLDQDAEWIEGSEYVRD